jgi:ssDNA-binding replication factor A large subunit
MVDLIYEKLLDKISKASGLEKEELERRVEAKRAKLSGLISKEGAAQVVAAELGISFDNEKVKIDELNSGMRKVNVLGKVIGIFPVRSFVRNGKEGKVANLMIADETSNIKAVLWDTHHIDLIESGDISENKVVEIYNASMRGNELHLSSFSELKLSSESLGEVKKDKMFREKEISDFKLADSVKTRAFIVQAFEPKIFNVCPECKRKAELQGEQFICAEHGKIAPEKRALMNVVIDDGTETIRSIFFNDVLGEIGISNLENTEALASKKEELLGKEMFFSGDIRLNRFFNNPEFIIEKAEEISTDEILKKLDA